MALALRPIIKTLEDIIFKDPDIRKLHANLKISIRKDVHYNFIVNNVPVILKKCINNVLISAQNLTMLRQSDAELFRACIHGDVSLSLCFSAEKLEDYLFNLKNMFIQKQGAVSALFIRYKTEAEAKRIAEMKTRTDKLRAIAQDFQSEQHQTIKVREMKRFLNNQLQDVLLDQIKAQRINNAYTKELEREYEKKLLND